MTPETLNRIKENFRMKNEITWHPESNAPMFLDRCLVWVADIDPRTKKPIGICLGQISHSTLLADGRNGNWQITDWAFMPEGPRHE